MAWATREIWIDLKTLYGFFSPLLRFLLRVAFWLSVIGGVLYLLVHFVKWAWVN